VPQKSLDRFFRLRLQPTFVAVSPNIEEVALTKMKRTHPGKFCRDEILSWIRSDPLVAKLRISWKCMERDGLATRIRRVSTFTPISGAFEAHSH